MGEYDAERPTPNPERRISKTVAFDVGYSTFDIRRFFLLKGRVAESGLRHSTRNRAWGNPPWVRIPPLPFTYEKRDRIAKSKSRITSVSHGAPGNGPPDR